MGLKVDNLMEAELVINRDFSYREKDKEKFRRVKDVIHPKLVTLVEATNIPRCRPTQHFIEVITFVKGFGKDWHSLSEFTIKTSWYFREYNNDLETYLARRETEKYVPNLRAFIRSGVEEILPIFKHFFGIREAGFIKHVYPFLKNKHNKSLFFKWLNCNWYGTEYIWDYFKAIAMCIGEIDELCDLSERTTPKIHHYIVTGISHSYKQWEEHFTRNWLRCVSCNETDPGGEHQTCPECGGEFVPICNRCGGDLNIEEMTCPNCGMQENCPKCGLLLEKIYTYKLNKPEALRCFGCRWEYTLKPL